MEHQQQRIPFIVWVNDTRAARNLERFGNVHYISKKLKYVVIYMDPSQSQPNMERMQKLPYVKRVEPSLRHELPTEFSSSFKEKSRAIPPS
jgi:uncharacterized protein YlbG (UPF0298 family)